METLTQATTINPTQIPFVVSTATYVQAMQSAFTSSKFALQLELATSLAVFASTGRVDRDTRKILQEVYVAAGWDATSPEKVDYKTTMRRIQIASILYVHLGRDVIASWIAGSAEMMTINTIVSHIAPLNLSSMDGTLVYCGKVRQRDKPRPIPAPSPEARAEAERIMVDEQPQAPIEGVTGTGELAEGHEGPLQPHLFRRSSDKETGEMAPDDEAKYERWLALRGETPKLNLWEIEQGYHHVTTEHISISVPPICSKQEIIDAALALMALASSMDGANTVADLPKESAETSSEEPEEPEDEEATKRLMQQESERVAAEALAAKAKPVAQASASRYRAKPISKK
jgi:hypothetical protein